MVEFAVCMPLLSILALGSVEISIAIFLKQALVTSSYEGACQAVKATSTTAAAESSANKCLSFRNIRNASIVISPGSVEAIARGQQIRVTVSAPLSGNSPLIGRIIANQTLTASTTMVKEKLP